MKKKILAILIIGMFVMTASSSFAVAIKTNNENGNYETGKKSNTCGIDVELEIWTTPDIFLPGDSVTITTEITNTGDTEIKQQSFLRYFDGRFITGIVKIPLVKPGETVYCNRTIYWPDDLDVHEIKIIFIETAYLYKSAVEDAGYPDLIPEFNYYKEVYIDGGSRYRYELKITNIGTYTAIKPEGPPLFNLYSVYPFVENQDHDFVTERIELLPGESYISNDFSVPPLIAFGSKHWMTVDPENVTYEGHEGENNNECFATVSRQRTKQVSNTVFLQNSPNLHQLFKRILKL